MEGKYERKIIAFFIMLLPLVGTMCSEEKKLSPSDISDGLNLSMPSGISDGDLICRLGNGFFSGYFQRLNGKGCRFSHIGILSCEGDSLYVYHAEASELTGEGQVLKIPFEVFAKDALEWEVFPLGDSVVGAEVVKWAELYRSKPTPFDMDFDLSSDSALYCTELVAKCVNLSYGKDTILPTGEIRGLRYYSVEDVLFFLKK